MQVPVRKLAHGVNDKKFIHAFGESIMWFGVTAGFVSALLQSTSYLFSRRFVLKHRNPGLLVVYSQLVMFGFGLLTLAATLPFVRVPLNGTFCMLLAVFVAASCSGYFCFFQALREIEASRLSSLLGLKIVVLAAITVAILHQPLNGLQYLAIGCSAVAAVGMNFSGGALSPRGCLFLLLTLLTYATADFVETAMILMMPGESLLLNSVAVTGVAFSVLGCVSSLAFVRLKWNRSCFIDAIPYAAAWYLAMLFLFTSFGAIGVLFGNIIQAGRGLISVLLGLLLLRFGFAGLEPRVGARAWTRRAVMAGLMLIAMTLYSCAGRQS